MIKDIEVKALRLLADAQQSVMYGMKTLAADAIAYNKDNNDGLIEKLKQISNADKWRKEDKSMIELMNYLLNDNETELRRIK